MTVTVFTHTSCSSSRKTIDWLREQNIPFIEKKLTDQGLSFGEFKEMLSLTENGTTDLLSVQKSVYKQAAEKLDEMSIRELYSFVASNPQILKSPILFDHHRIQVGFSEKEIRTFIPRNDRIAELKRLLHNA
ncbi:MULTISPECIES: Spx/MgsR family RNA polymerase-binding regulatory protein [unclassified Exiguobacterium]|uniref:Spx/MgsR family RNA polymerase-binding regulatory protein n=1 Tax=unclassified Exiguobacterium TaxID=2644629 RepID=UPI001BEC9BF7